MKKEAQKETPTETTPPQSNNNALAIVSIVLGIVSLTGPGLIFGIPAIITGAIALKKSQGERGLSITGIVTGIISTVISLVVIAFFVFIFIWALSHPEDFKETPRQAPTREMLHERS
jgi:O-antigen/teichoic acid export membrane protein